MALIRGSARRLHRAPLWFAQGVEVRQYRASARPRPCRFLEKNSPSISIDRGGDADRSVMGHTGSLRAPSYCMAPRPTWARDGTGKRCGSCAAQRQLLWLRYQTTATPQASPRTPQVPRTNNGFGQCTFPKAWLLQRMHRDFPCVARDKNCPYSISP